MCYIGVPQGAGQLTAHQICRGFLLLLEDLVLLGRVGHRAFGAGLLLLLGRFQDVVGGIYDHLCLFHHGPNSAPLLVKRSRFILCRHQNSEQSEDTNPPQAQQAQYKHQTRRDSVRDSELMRPRQEFGQLVHVLIFTLNLASVVANSCFLRAFSAALMAFNAATTSFSVCFAFALSTASHCKHA